MKLFTRQEIRADEQKALSSIREKQSLAEKGLNERVQKMNNIDVEYSKKTSEKQRELAEAKMDFAKFIASKTKSIESLEQRREQALLPIKEELETLEKRRLEVKKREEAALEERQARTKYREQLSIISGQLEKALKEIEATRQTVDSELSQKRREADAAVEMAAITTKALDKDRERTELLLGKFTVKEKELKRAEEMAKKAILQADVRIEQELILQKQTDDKRRMLAVAISELKKKGLWHKRLETITK